MKEKMPAGLLAIIFGCLGLHKFYLGYTKEAVIMLLVTVLTFGIGGTVMAVFGLVEGITNLTRSDEDFQEIYVDGHKGWF